MKAGVIWLDRRLGEELGHLRGGEGALGRVDLLAKQTLDITLHPAGLGRKARRVLANLLDPGSHQETDAAVPSFPGIGSQLLCITPVGPRPFCLPVLKEGARILIREEWRPGGGG